MFDDFSERKSERRHDKRHHKSSVDEFEEINRQFAKDQSDNEDYGGYKRPSLSKPDAPPEEIKKEEVNFEPSGILAEETNQVRGVVLKFTEPLDAAVPGKNEEWRIYPFKGDQSLGKNLSSIIISLDPISLGSK